MVTVQAPDYLSRSEPPTMGDQTTERFVLDTNVVIDIVSIHDLSRQAARGAEGVDYRRRRARHALLLANYFHESRTRTLSLHEALETLKRRVPREEETFERSFIQIFLYFVKERVLEDWAFRHLNDTDHLTGNAADDELLKIAHHHELSLITNEDLTPSGLRPTPKPGSLRAKAEAANVPVFTAEELLEARSVDATSLTRGFFDRWDKSVLSHIAEHRRQLGDDQIEGWMEMTRDLYEWVLSPGST